MISLRPIRIAVGFSSWLVILLFAIMPSLNPRYYTGMTSFALALTTIFLILAPFIAIPDDYQLQRLSAFAIFCLGVLCFLTLPISGGILEALLGPAGIICILLGMLILSDAILLNCLVKPRLRAFINLISAGLCLIALVAGPLLVGLPILNWLDKIK